MFFFTRQATLRGPQADVMSLATDVTTKVNSLLPDHEVHLWQSLFGAPMGTLAWTSVYEGRADVGNVQATLASDADFVALADSAQTFFSGVQTEDTLAEMVYMPEGMGSEVGTIVEGVTATIAPGHLPEAMAFGVEISQQVAEIAGSQTAFATSCYGTFGEVSWYSMYDSLEDVDRVQAALGTSETYLSAVTKGGPLFDAGSGNRMLAVRLI